MYVRDICDTCDARLTLRLTDWHVGIAVEKISRTTPLYFHSIKMIHSIQNNTQPLKGVYNN